MLSRDTVKEFFTRISSGLKRLGSEPVTKGVDFTVSPDGTEAIAVVRDGFELIKKPQRKRNRRTHTFHDVGSLAGWLLGKGADPKQTEILVATTDRGRTLFTAALDPGEYGGDVVTCELVHHPRYARWAKLFDTPVTHEALLKHLYAVGEDTGRATATVKGESELVDLGPLADKWAGELASFTVDKDHSATTEINRYGVITLSGGTSKTTTSSDLPSVFEIKVPIFRGIEVDGNEPGDEGILVDATYTIQVRLYISTKDGVKFTLEAPDLAIVLDKATEDAVAHLTRDLGDGWLVGRGQMRLTETFDRDAVVQGCAVVGAED